MTPFSPERFDVYLPLPVLLRVFVYVYVFVEGVFRTTTAFDDLGD